MREILFRGQRVDNGKEVIGFYFNVPEHHNPDLSGKSIIISINNGLYFEVVPETVIQYTRLTDKEIEFSIKHDEKVRKETAREILEPLREVVMEYPDCCINLSEDIKFLWEKYGLESEGEE